MTQTIIFSILFIVIGLFSIISSLANWDFFFNHRRAQFFLKIFGRNGARIFYVLLGLVIFSVGILSITGHINLD